MHKKYLEIKKACINYKLFFILKKFTCPLLITALFLISCQSDNNDQNTIQSLNNKNLRIDSSIILDSAFKKVQFDNNDSLINSDQEHNRAPNNILEVNVDSLLSAVDSISIEDFTTLDLQISNNTFLNKNYDFTEINFYNKNDLSVVYIDYFDGALLGSKKIIYLEEDLLAIKVSIIEQIVSEIGFQYEERVIFNSSKNQINKFSMHDVADFNVDSILKIENNFDLEFINLHMNLIDK